MDASYLWPFGEPVYDGAWQRAQSRPPLSGGEGCGGGSGWTTLDKCRLMSRPPVFLSFMNHNDSAQCHDALVLKMKSLMAATANKYASLADNEAIVVRQQKEVEKM